MMPGLEPVARQAVSGLGPGVTLALLSAVCFALPWWAARRRA